MATESDPYDQIADFNCRKILLDMIKEGGKDKEEEKEEEEEEEEEEEQDSAGPIDKKQLIRIFF